jgi:AbrB family looped-hinge helix DNA binding protein
METTKLSSKGQVVIPKSLRSAHHWESGQELVVVDAGDGVLFKPKSPFTETSISEVAACLKFAGKSRSLDDMDSAIRTGVKNKYK